VRAQWVVEKALQVRIREEKLKKGWLNARERWIQGELTKGWGIMREYIESFQKGEEYREGPYRQWVGYTDPRETSTGVGESLQGEERGNTGREESWEGLTDEEGSSTGLQDGWGGFPGENEVWEGPREGGSFASASEAWEGSREEGEGFAGRIEAWEGSREEGEGSASGNKAWEGSRKERESFAGESTGGKGLAGESEAWKGPQEIRESPQEQYCSSCNRKKPLTDFGQFFTCNACRERNKKANRVRKAKQKRAIPPRPKATNEQLEYAIQALAPTSEYRLGLNFATRPITIEDYLNKSS
jgi:hypothetical protein